MRGDASRSSFKEAVSKLEVIVADYIHRLKTIGRAERQAIIERTAGSLTPEEGDKLARIIEEGRR